MQSAMLGGVMKTKPITLLAFDPSLHATGWAFFRDGNYDSSGVIKLPKKHKGLEAITNMLIVWQRFRTNFRPEFRIVKVIVTEIQEYRHQNERAAINNLLLLNGVCFAFFGSGWADERVAYTPKQWKGTTPKKIHNQRVKDYIGGLDIKDDNELDAIGLGLSFWWRYS